jgi:hypothetical protein
LLTELDQSREKYEAFVPKYTYLPNCGPKRCITGVSARNVKFLEGEKPAIPVA